MSHNFSLILYLYLAEICELQRVCFRYHNGSRYSVIRGSFSVRTAIYRIITFRRFVYLLRPQNEFYGNLNGICKVLKI